MTLVSEIKQICFSVKESGIWIKKKFCHICNGHLYFLFPQKGPLYASVKHLRSSDHFVGAMLTVIQLWNQNQKISVFFAPISQWWLERYVLLNICVPCTEWHLYLLDHNFTSKKILLCPSHWHFSACLLYSIPNFLSFQTKWIIHLPSQSEVSPFFVIHYFIQIYFHDLLFST